MKKYIYIFPGWEDSCDDVSYQKISAIAREKKYEVICQNIDWKKPLSNQILKIKKNAILFGFSLGAILAWLIAQKYPCKKIILASMTPHYSFKNPDIKQALVELAGTAFIENIIEHLETKHRAEQQIILYGDLENERADILVKNTEHELTDAYINEIKKIL